MRIKKFSKKLLALLIITVITFTAFTPVGVIGSIHEIDIFESDELSEPVPGKKGDSSNTATEGGIANEEPLVIVQVGPTEELVEINNHETNDDNTNNTNNTNSLEADVDEVYVNETNDYDANAHESNTLEIFEISRLLLGMYNTGKVTVTILDKEWIFEVTDKAEVFLNGKILQDIADYTNQQMPTVAFDVSLGTEVIIVAETTKYLKAIQYRVDEEWHYPYHVERDRLTQKFTYSFTMTDELELQVVSFTPFHSSGNAYEMSALVTGDGTVTITTDDGRTFIASSITEEISFAVGKESVIAVDLIGRPAGIRLNGEEVSSLDNTLTIAEDTTIEIDFPPQKGRSLPSTITGTLHIQEVKGDHWSGGWPIAGGADTTLAFLPGNFNFDVNTQIQVVGATHGLSGDYFSGLFVCANHSAAAPAGGVHNATATFSHQANGWHYYNVFVHSGTVGQGIHGPIGGWETGTFLSGVQNVAGVIRMRPSLGDLTIQKHSGNTKITEYNPMYSLEGAQFALYDGTTRIKTGSTDKNGVLHFTGLSAGSYQVSEITPPRGFALATESFNVTITGGEVTTITVENHPQVNPTQRIVHKIDKDKSNSSSGKVGLEGAEFTIHFYGISRPTTCQIDPATLGHTPQKSWVLKTDALGIADLGDEWLVSGDSYFLNVQGLPVLPLGTVTIQETKAPPGYLIDPTVFVRHITSEGTLEAVNTFQPIEVSNRIIRGGIRIEKWDYELMANQPQGNATLLNTMIQIISDNSNPISIDGEIYEFGEVIHTLTTDSNGVAQTPNYYLPYGDYLWKEITPPIGYLGSGRVEGRFSIRENGVMVNLNTSTTSAQNNVIRGGVEVVKVDRELNLWHRITNIFRPAQGDGTLSGIEFDIRNANENPVVFQGQVIPPGDVIASIFTEYDVREGKRLAYARTTSNDLPYGTYEIKEVATHDSGYLLTDGEVRTFQIREQGVIVMATISGNDLIFENDIIRGDVLIIKDDVELGKSESLGGEFLGNKSPDAELPDSDLTTNGTTLIGIPFEFTNQSSQVMIVDGQLFEPGEVIFIKPTTWLDHLEAYGIETTKGTFPFGTIGIREIGGNASYLLTDGEMRYVQIRRDRKLVTVDINGDDLVWRNQVKRGDVEFVKIEESTHNRLSVPFAITNVITGEIHVAVTDRNGTFSSHASWNDRISANANVNANDHLLDMEAKGEIITTNDMNPMSAIWFGLGEFGSTASVDKELGALMYGLYHIREMPAETNEGLELLEFYFFVFRDGITVNLSTLINRPIPVPPTPPTPPDPPVLPEPPTKPEPPAPPIPPTVFVGTRASTCNGTATFPAGDTITVMDRIILSHTWIPEEGSELRNRSYQAHFHLVEPGINPTVNPDDVLAYYSTEIRNYEITDIVMVFHEQAEIDMSKFHQDTWGYWSLDVIDHKGNVVYTHNKDGSDPNQAIHPYIQTKPEDEPKAPNKPNAPNTPQTGDDGIDYIGIFIALLILSGAIVILVRRGKEKEKSKDISEGKREDNDKDIHEDKSEDINKDINEDKREDRNNGINEDNE